MTKVLVAHDSALVRKTVCDIIGSGGECQFIICRDGDEALEKIISLRPELIVVSMMLPKKNGIEIINALNSKKVLFKSILLIGEAQEDRDAALMFEKNSNIRTVLCPFRIFGAGHQKFSQDLSDAANELIKMRPEVRTSRIEPKKPVAEESSVNGVRNKIVAIASSTGGPQALNIVIPRLPLLGVPVVVVQHMPKGFTLSLAERINQISSMKVKEATDGEELMPNVVYIAPGGRHLEVVESGRRTCIRIFDDPPVNSLRPCADVMFKSLANTHYSKIVCAVLTGMGKDGSEGIKYLKERKKIRVVTQSKETCVVYGMPKAADECGLSDKSVPVDMVADAIKKELEVI
jgi:two-component system chemotaxis response regulator CheB